MVRNLVFAALVAASGTAFPGLAPDWVAVPPGQDEYAHFTRHVPNGPDETLIASARHCDCDPRSVIDGLERAFDDKPAAFISSDPVSACGRTVQHILVTAVADVAGRRNLEVYAFRNADSLVVISFFFTKADPTASDEASMQALCPVSPAS
jgi:hypothetical protein